MPARPVKGFEQGNAGGKIQGQLHHGLTRREHFAGLALQGLLAAYGTDYTYKRFAEESVLTADALLKALEDE